MTYELFDKDGKRITPVGNVIPDGATLRVPQLVMDAAPRSLLHRPGSVPLAASERDAREAAYEDRKRRLSDQWRSPAPSEPVAGAKPAPTAPLAAVAGASDADVRYAARCGALEQAWRN
ncbi:hypothetical protein ABIB83_006478 [Bradyrhizobium sp. I1.8.5]|uniref:hypothetical protein n=1 Tax=Bradyrhizobium sp. I1.8.5 TaxID=3156365 RepID=UPI003391E772